MSAVIYKGYINIITMEQQIVCTYVIFDKAIL